MLRRLFVHVLQKFYFLYLLEHLNLLAGTGNKRSKHDLAHTRSISIQLIRIDHLLLISAHVLFYNWVVIGHGAKVIYCFWIESLSQDHFNFVGAFRLHYDYKETGDYSFISLILMAVIYFSSFINDRRSLNFNWSFVNEVENKNALERTSGR